jgi:hypothetical protein
VEEFFEVNEVANVQRGGRLWGSLSWQNLRNVQLIRKEKLRRQNLRNGQLIRKEKLRRQNLRNVQLIRKEKLRKKKKKIGRRRGNFTFGNGKQVAN